MRPIFLMTAALTASLLMAGAAAAAPPPSASGAPVFATPPPEPEEALPPIEQDQAQADAMTRQLAAFDDRIRADEQRITTLRDAEMAKENARIRAIKPALPFHGATWLPGWL
jgi:TolA-binding protein